MVEKVSTKRRQQPLKAPPLKQRRYSTPSPRELADRCGEKTFKEIVKSLGVVTFHRSRLLLRILWHTVLMRAKRSIGLTPTRRLCLTEVETVTTLLRDSWCGRGPACVIEQFPRPTFASLDLEGADGVHHVDLLAKATQPNQPR